MTLCERIAEGEGGIPWETIIKVAGLLGVWVIVLLLWRRK